MIIASWRTSHALASGGTFRITLLFGFGLIGRSIMQSLAIRSSVKLNYLPFSWDCESDRELHRNQICRTVAELVRSVNAKTETDIIWSAGRAGFGSHPDVLSAEQKSFESVLRITESISRVSDIQGIRFHLFSSAGGLFEGQRKVNANSTIKASRPYGSAKLKQERQCHSLPNKVVCLIYRPSSVYGWTSETSREGLITATLKAAYTNSTVKIYAQPDTLRDYIYSSDIGRFVANKILVSQTKSTIFHLASGKPCSTTEILCIIEKVLDRNIFVQYELDADNIQHNTYCQTVIPADLSITPISAGIYQTALRLRQE